MHIYHWANRKTCLIHGPGHSSDECKVLGDFDHEYAKGKLTKDHGNNPVPRNKFNRQQENNAIVNNEVDEILLNETQKVSASKEATYFWNMIMTRANFISLKT